MQTFLPYPDFLTSAKVLDKRRCWKQVVEAKQIIACLENTGCQRWKNHPAVKMWVGHVDSLQYYYNVFLKHSKEVHGINTKLEYICNYYTGPCVDGSIVFMSDTYPWWLGNEDFHRAMRARLIEKYREFYLSKFPNDENYNDSLYWWPDMETKTFKIIKPK